jgi:hypothetical protein
VHLRGDGRGLWARLENALGQTREKTVFFATKTAFLRQKKAIFG